MKEPFCIDLIKGKALGTFRGWENINDSNRKYVRVLPLFTKKKDLFIPFGNEEVVIRDYRLDPEKDVIMENGGEIPIMYLIPVSDIPEVNKDKTIFYRIGQSEFSQRVKDLESEVKDLRKEKGKYEKELNRLKDEEQEKRKYGEKKQRKGYFCKDCETKLNVTDAKDGVCPHCNSTDLEVIE